MSVIHGTGQPRIEIESYTLITDIVSSSTSTSVVLTNTSNLAAIDNIYVLVNRMVMTYNSSNAETWGKITSFDETSKVLYVASWNNGNPDTGKEIRVKNFRIDLPYCQSLIESWIPDFLIYRMFNGNIEISKKGFYYSALLDYSQWLKGSLVEYLRPLFRMDHKNFIFYPRSDNTSVSYVVDLDPATEFLLQQARHHRFHKLVKIKLIGVRRLNEINLKLPEGTGYGYKYGQTGYGNQL